MNKLKVTIICGGFSNEREVSLKSGQSIANVLNREKYEITVLELGDDRDWHKNNTQLTDQSTDIVFIALHGKYGEDGTIQSILDNLNIPYTGSGVSSSRLAMDKKACLEAVRSIGVKTPECILLHKDDLIDITDIQLPCVVKPNQSGSSIGISIVQNRELLGEAIAYAFKEDSHILIEQYIEGREFTCAVLGNTGLSDLIALPVAEIITHDEPFFDYSAKYFSKTVEEVCPAKIDPSISEEIQRLSKQVHEHVGCDGLSRSDFIITNEGQIYFLEINTIPGMTDVSLSPKEAIAAGMSFDEFIEKQIELALKKKNIMK